MTCQSAIVSNVQTVSPETKVSEVMNIIYQHEVHSVAVIDDKGGYVGLFGFSEIVDALLPAGANVEGGVDNLRFMMGTHDAAADKFDEIEDRPIVDFCNKTKPVVYPNTVFWEGLMLLHKYGSPITAVNPETNEFLGFLTKRSALTDLQFHTNKSDASGNKGEE